MENLLDPFVFNRFNDGIIQAANLRAAKSGELNYSYSRKNSEDMLMVLKTFVNHHSEYQGEALLEFLHAIAIGKLRLFKKHYPPLIDDLDCIVNEYVSTLKNKIEEIYKSTI